MSKRRQGVTNDPQPQAGPSGSRNVDPPAEDGDGPTRSSSDTQPSDEEYMRERAQILQDMVEAQIRGDISADDLNERLRALNYSLPESEEARTQAKQRMQRGEGGRMPGSVEVGLSGPQLGDRFVAGQVEQPATVPITSHQGFSAEADWALFGAKMRAAAFRPQIQTTGNSPFTVATMGATVAPNPLHHSVPPSMLPPAQTGNSSAIGTGLPPKPLAAAFPGLVPTSALPLAGSGAPQVHPMHFAFPGSSAHAYASVGSGDPHIDETWRIRRLFSSDKSVDDYVDQLQLAQLHEPLVRSIWKKLIQDDYVNFEKLYATLGNSNIEFEDEGREFAAGYFLVRKGNIASSKHIATESEWCRVFDAWRVGVVLIYPHRLLELDAYRRAIVDIFHSFSVNPAVAIGTDKEVRLFYARSKFRLDNSHLLQMPLLSQVSAHISGIASHLASGSPSRRQGRQGSTSAGTSSRRIEDPCENWNLGNCPGDKCQFRRLHLICSECGKQHRAKDVEQCHSALLARRGSRFGVRPSASSSGGRRTQTN